MYERHRSLIKTKGSSKFRNKPPKSPPNRCEELAIFYTSITGLVLYVFDRQVIFLILLEAIVARETEDLVACHTTIQGDTGVGNMGCATEFGLIAYSVQVGTDYGL